MIRWPWKRQSPEPLDRHFGNSSVDLKVTSAPSGSLLRIALSVACHPRNVAVTWTADGTVHRFTEGYLRDETQRTHPLARVAELIPSDVPDDLIRQAVESLALDHTLQRDVLALLIGNSESKSAR